MSRKVSRKRQFFSASRLASPSQVMGNNPRFSGIMGLLDLVNFGCPFEVGAVPFLCRSHGSMP